MVSKNSLKVLMLLVSFILMISCGGVGKYCSKDGAYCLDFGGGTVNAGPKSDAGWPIGSFPWEYMDDKIYFKLADGKNVICKQSADKATMTCEGGSFDGKGGGSVTFQLKK